MSKHIAGTSKYPLLAIRMNLHPLVTGKRSYEGKHRK